MGRGNAFTWGTPFFADHEGESGGKGAPVARRGTATGEETEGEGDSKLSTHFNTVAE